MRTIILAVAVLAGCASAPPSVVGTEHAVTVNWSGSAQSRSLAAAEAHCQKYGRYAQFSGKPNAFTDAYNCVKK